SSAALTNDEIQERLLKAVAAGKLDARILGRFATYRNETLKMIPAEVRQEFDIPDIDTDGRLVKSYLTDPDDAAPTSDEIQERLVKAVEDRKLDPCTLGDFATNGAEALRRIPEDVRKSYGLPDPTGPEPSRLWYPWMPRGLLAAGYKPAPGYKS